MSVAVAAEALDREWDIFISYAREDSGWVNEHIYEPLLRCKTESGARPIIFLDVSKEGIPSGMNIYKFIGEALQRSQFIVPIYSQTYFQKKMCSWELFLALELHLQGTAQLHPVLRESAAAAKVPYEVNQINWYPVDWPDWFERLCRDLHLTIERTSPSLRFRSQIGEVTERHTLPAVEVVIVDRETGAVLPSIDAVTIRAVGADVEGTLVAQAEGGIATFRDLSFSAAAPQARLVAEAPGCEPVVSTPFPVRPAAPVVPDGRPRRIGARGVPVFLPDGQTLAVVGDAGIAVFAADATPVADASFPGQLRMRAQGESCLAFADWSGYLVLLDHAGRVRSFDLAGGEQALSIPGALCFVGDRAYVGMWNGTVWSLSLDAPKPQREFEHPAGVQALAAAGDRWLVAGLDGNLTVYTPGGSSEVHALEPLILGMRVWPDRAVAVAVGEREVHRLSLRASTVLHQELPVGETVGALVDGLLAVALDADGRGVRFDSELNIRGGFRVARGARPVAVDRAGTSVVFAYPGGSYVLMVNDRVVFSSSSGPLAISPDGRRVAVDDGDVLRVASLSELGVGAIEPVAS